MTDESQISSIEAGLDTLKPSLNADGFDLRLDSVADDGKVSVILEARADACHDCLVPEEMLTSIVTSAIAERWPDVGEVVLSKEGFDDAVV